LVALPAESRIVRVPVYGLPLPSSDAGLAVILKLIPDELVLPLMGLTESQGAPIEVEAANAKGFEDIDPCVLSVIVCETDTPPAEPVSGIRVVLTFNDSLPIT
jgi:hypothetical protein